VLGRIASHWVYGGSLAGLVLLALLPVLTEGWSAAQALGFLALPAYMLHQFEEHDDDRFRRFVNAEIGGGREALSVAEVFHINFWGVWVYLACATMLSRLSDPGWSALAGWLLLVNAAAHVGQGAVMRRYNPGLVTAILFFVPLGSLILVRSGAQWWQQAVAVALAVLVHAAIVARVRWRLRQAPAGT
jgi:Protein of unknown function with HXXEE motif